MTGKDFPVRAVLTFPGCEIIERKLAAVRVVYTRGVRDCATGLGNDILAAVEIDLAPRQLEEESRDAAY